MCVSTLVHMKKLWSAMWWYLELGLWELIMSWGWNSHTGISVPYIKEQSTDLSLPYEGRHTKEEVIGKLGSQMTGTLISKLVRNKCCFSHQIYGIHPTGIKQIRTCSQEIKNQGLTTCHKAVISASTNKTLQYMLIMMTIKEGKETKRNWDMLYTCTSFP